MERQLLKVITAALLCIAIDEAKGDEKIHSNRELLEQVLRIPNPERVLNSVLGKLEQSKPERLIAVASMADQDDEECLDPLEVSPEYTDTLYDTRGRELRQLGIQKHYPICHVERKILYLSSKEYEYKPAYYEQVECVRPNRAAADSSNDYVLNICSSLGFSCVQWNKTIHFTRRRYSSDCWEAKTLQIPAGCECMWPAHKLGDINLHV